VYLGSVIYVDTKFFVTGGIFYVLVLGYFFRQMCDLIVFDYSLRMIVFAALVVSDHWRTVQPRQASDAPLLTAPRYVFQLHSVVVAALGLWRTHQ
jgi:hypothetical protein